MCTTRFQGCPSKILRYEGTGVNHFLGGIRIFCAAIHSEMSEILEIRTFHETIYPQKVRIIVY